MYINITEKLAKDPWFKVVDFLQQNWAVIVNRSTDVLIVFYGDTCGVFDEISYSSIEGAKQALKRNGFAKFCDDKQAQTYISLPNGEFREKAHPNGRIYSSGRYWK
jgi:hypothetical protein